MALSNPSKNASAGKAPVADPAPKSAPPRKAAGSGAANARRPAAAAKARTVEAPPPAIADKPAKVVKRAKARPRLVRDGFTMPEADFALIAALKTRALEAQRHAKKSELLRAGLRALAAMDAKTLVEALDRLETVKIGRPRKGH